MDYYTKKLKYPRLIFFLGVWCIYRFYGSAVADPTICNSDEIYMVQAAC